MCNMKTPTTMVVSVFLALAVVCESAANAQFIVNGNFDVSVPRNDTGGGWTSAHIDGSGGWFSGGGIHGGTFILNEGGESATDPTISQLVSGLVPGQTYLLSGDYANVYSGSGNPSALSFAIDIDGVNRATLGRPGGDDVYGRFAVRFEATSTNALISFRAEVNGDDSSYRIDNIELRPDTPMCANMTIEVTDIRVCWFAESNRLYQVEYRSALTTNMWAPFGSTVVGIGTNYCIADSVLQAPQRFYRIQCLTNDTAR